MGLLFIVKDTKGKEFVRLNLIAFAYDNVRDAFARGEGKNSAE